MKKVQFFTGNNTDELQLQVNEWLAQNRNISIIDSDMTCLHEHISFYILYLTRRQKKQETDTKAMEYQIPSMQNVKLKGNMTGTGN